MRHPVVNVNIVNNPDFVNSLLLTTLLLLWSKITVKIVNNPDLVNILLLTKKFTKSGVDCIIRRIRRIRLVSDKDKIKIARLVKGVFLKHTNYHTQTQDQTDPKLTQPNSVEETLLVRFEFVSLFYSGVVTYFVHFSQTRCRKLPSKRVNSQKKWCILGNSSFLLH